MFIRTASLLTLVLLLGTAAAADWPQWLGPTREPVWDATGLLTKFPAGGPKVVWRRPIAAGYAGPAVADGRVYVTDRRKKDPDPNNPLPKGTIPGTERVVCLNAADGTEVWAHEYDRTYVKVSYPSGPRTTPVVEKDRLYTLGAMGDLLCLNPADGKVLWAKNFPKDLKAPTPAWGWSAHLLVDGDRLIALVGGEGQAVVAFDKKTGDVVWKALTTEEICYAPPVVIEAGGTRQLVVWLSEAVYGLNPETGATHWKEKHPGEGRPTRPAVSIITPKRVGDKLVVSSYYHGTLALTLAADKPAVSVAWRSKMKKADEPEGLNVTMTSLLARDGHLYGVGGDGDLMALKLDTGEVVWQTKDLFGGKPAFCGTVFWVEAKDLVYGLTDQGDLIVAKLSPKGYEELSRAHVLEPTHAAQGRRAVWSHPAFAGTRVYMKNDKEMVCVDLAGG